jgi:hypothetical protein
MLYGHLGYLAGQISVRGRVAPYSTNAYFLREYPMYFILCMNKFYQRDHRSTVYDGFLRFHNHNFEKICTFRVHVAREPYIRFAFLLPFLRLNVLTRHLMEARHLDLNDEQDVNQKGVNALQRLILLDQSMPMTTDIRYASKIDTSRLSPNEPVLLYNYRPVDTSLTPSHVRMHYYDHVTFVCRFE